MRRILVLALFTIVFVSCNRDKTPPVINIISPENNLEVSPGESFNFKAEVTDDENLSSIVLSDGGSINERIIQFDDLTKHTLNYTINIIEESEPGEFMLSVTAKDLRNNESKEEVTVIIK